MVPVTASRGRTPLISGLHDRSAQTPRSRLPFAPCTLSGDHSQDRSWVRPGQPPHARQQNALSCVSLDTERRQHASSIPAQRLSGPASVDLVHAGPSSTAVRTDGGTSNGAQPQAAKAGGDSSHRAAQRQQPASMSPQSTAQHRPDGQRSVHSATAAAAAAASVAEHSGAPHSAPAPAELRCGTASDAHAGPSSLDEDEQPSESGFMPVDGLAAMHSGAEPPPAPPPTDGRPRWLRRPGGRDAAGGEALEDQPTESGVLPEERLTAVRPAGASCAVSLCWQNLYQSSWRLADHRPNFLSITTVVCCSGARNKGAMPAQRAGAVGVGSGAARSEPHGRAVSGHRRDAVPPAGAVADPRVVEQDHALVPRVQGEPRRSSMLSLVAA